MLIDMHCHIDAYPDPEQTLAAGEVAGVRTVAVTTSLGSYVRSRILCRNYPVHVALGLHPRRTSNPYEQWPEWREVLHTAPFVGEAGLDFRSGQPQNWATQAGVLAKIAEACGRERRVLMLHSHCAEAEAFDVVTAHHVEWVIWHDYRGDGPKSLLYRAITAGHMVSVGPDMVSNAALSSRLRAIPREQILTETSGPWSRLGTGDRAAGLREILARLAEAWRCNSGEAEAQVERNYARLMASALGHERARQQATSAARVGPGESRQTRGPALAASQA